MKSDKKGLIIAGIIISSIIIILSTITIVITLKSSNYNTRTIMIYMVGSDLESNNGLASADLNSIDKSIANDPSINVYLIAGGSKNWDNSYIDKSETSIFKLTTSGFNKVKSQTKQNMGKGETLTNFINYVYNDSKTDKYDLIFWNHGGAIDGSEYDELNSDDNLQLVEMNQALSNTPFKNKKLETVIFRTCLNGTIEVNTVFSKYSDYLVASEESTLGANYTSVLNFINNIKPTDNGKDVSKKFISAYKNQIVDIKNRSFKTTADTIYSTYSLVDLKEIEKLNNYTNEFFNDINVDANFNTISKVRANLLQYSEDIPEYDMVDLYNLIYNLKSLSPNKADKVLKQFDRTVIYNYATDSNSRGISIYFPYNGDKTYKDKFIKVYDNLNGFNNYKNFITNFYKIQSSDYKAYTYTSNLVKTTASDYQDDYADFELELTDEQVSTFAKAKYIVYRDNKDGYYKPIYMGKEAKLDGKILKASIKDRQLQVVSKNDEKYNLTAIEKENTDKYIKYETNVIMQSFKDISNYKMDNAIMTIYYDKNSKESNISNIIYNSKGEHANAIALDINDYDSVAFSVTSGWDILDDNGNYVGPIVENGRVKGDGIITGFEAKPNEFKFQISAFDDNYDYYCVFVITDTHNNLSYSKLIKLK